MLRSLVFLITLSAALQAAVLPEQFGSLKRSGAVETAAPNDPQLWDEFGFDSGETAVYAGPNGPVNVSLWKFKDTTGAFAAHQALGSGVQHRNYVVLFANGTAGTEDVKQLTSKLPRTETEALPPLFAYLPKRGRMGTSERYVLGPVSLSRFEPRISPQTAGFDRGAEAQTAKYRAGGKEIQLTIFAYPTPQIAIERFRQFEQVPNAASRRSGTLIAVVPDGKEIPAVGRLLEEVNYNPKLTWNEYVPKATPQDAAKMILAISVLAAGLIVASLILGLFSGADAFSRRSLA